MGLSITKTGALHYATAPAAEKISAYQFRPSNCPMRAAGM